MDFIKLFNLKKETQITKELNIDFNSENKELNLANLDKLELAIHLFEVKLEKDIPLPFDKVEVVGFNYVKLSRPDLFIRLNRILNLSRKVNVNFVVWEGKKQSAKDFQIFRVIIGRDLG